MQLQAAQQAHVVHEELWEALGHWSSFYSKIKLMLAVGHACMKRMQAY